MWLATHDSARGRVRPCGENWLFNSDSATTSSTCAGSMRKRDDGVGDDVITIDDSLFREHRWHESIPQAPYQALVLRPRGLYPGVSRRRPHWAVYTATDLPMLPKFRRPSPRVRPRAARGERAPLPRT